MYREIYVQIKMITGIIYQKVYPSQTLNYHSTWNGQISISSYLHPSTWRSHGTDKIIIHSRKSLASLCTSFTTRTSVRESRKQRRKKAHQPANRCLANSPSLIRWLRLNLTTLHEHLMLFPFHLDFSLYSRIIELHETFNRGYLIICHMHAM